MTPDVLERFMDRISPEPTTGCWLWTGPMQGNNYPALPPGQGRMLAAHRESYRHFHGPIPPGMCVCHRCDTPMCVNPDHLWVGTAADNVHDRDSKGRTARVPGGPNGLAKFTDDMVAIMRATVRARLFTCADWSRWTGASTPTVSKAVRGETWRHVA